MQNIYETFEFDKILSMLNEYSKTELGKEYISSLVMLKNEEEVKYALEELNEIFSLVSRFGPLPISTSANAIELIEIAKKSSILSPRDLNLIANDIDTIDKIIEYVKKIGLNYIHLSEKINRFHDLSSLYRAIHKTITNALTVNDKATPRLFEIRTKLKKLEASIQEKVTNVSYKYSEYLSDNNATIRDGHFVLPVKTMYKNKIVGAIYDVSDTGNTTFIEPLEIISLNNEITSLKVEENEEVRKILKELTSLVLLQEDEVIENNKVIAELDFLNCKALFAKENNFCIGELISKNRVIELKDAYHPLLDRIKVIKNSYYLDDIKRIIIISGPNAGGKTVTLKTIGICVLMNQCGLPIPANSAKLSYFKNIYIDIGDNQSLSDNLSTFSAHMSHISEITSLVGGKDLVLIDELGTGTDPKEGEAIALGVTKALISSHAFSLISSHFSSLKEFALTNTNIENSSMLFDEENLQPTYIFKLGVPGKSYGLEVAERYGIKKTILDDAKNYLANNYSSKSEELISTLQKKVEQNSKIAIELEKENKRLIREAKRVEIDSKNLEEKRAKLLESVKEEKQALIDETREQIDEIMKALNKGDLKLHDIIALKKKLDDLEENEIDETYNEELDVNDNVYVPSLESYGIIESISNNKCKVILDTGITININLNRLKRSDKPLENKRATPKAHINFESVHCSLELNIIGYHVEEGKYALIKYIDDCRLAHLHQVRIIHGYGSGALRKMTHEYLKTQKDLTFSLADGPDGGAGATLVKFND